MVVAAHHHRSDLTLAYHAVELAGNFCTALGVGVEDTCLGADHQRVGLGVTDPLPVVSVLAASVGVDAAHRRDIGLAEIFRLTRQTHPTEGSVAIVEAHGTHDVLDVRGPDEALGGVVAVPCDLRCAGVEDRLHEGVAVVPETRALFGQALEDVEVPDQAFVYQRCKALAVGSQQLATLLEGHARRCVAAVIRHVARGLVGVKVDRDVIGVEILEEIDDIALVGNGQSLAFLGRL